MDEPLSNLDAILRLDEGRTDRIAEETEDYAALCHA